MDSLFERLAERKGLRRLADAGLRHYARRRVAELDRRPADAVQRRVLSHLIGRARHTRFGREHDFDRIRTVEDYQRRVPLRDYEAFWSCYWSRPFPRLQGVTWPGPVPYFALSSGTTSGAT